MMRVYFRLFVAVIAIENPISGGVQVDLCSLNAVTGEADGRNNCLHTSPVGKDPLMGLNGSA